MDQLCADHCALWRRYPSAQPELHRAIPRHGVCTTDLPREFARYRNLFAGQSKQAVWHGVSHTARRSTLADANEGRDWGIWADLAALLIRRARKLYGHERFGVDLDNIVYALDATTIDLCLSLFPWAPFRSTKAAVKLHTLVDLRGNIPAFIPLSDCKTSEVNVLDMLPIEAGAFFVTRAKRGMDARRVYSMSSDRHSGVIYDQRIVLNGFYVSRDYPEQL